MEDLLNEEEFITQKPYNPWRRFIVFYGIAALNMTILYLIMFSLDDMSYNSQLILIPLFLAIPPMPFIMIFHKKKNAFLKKFIIITAVSILMIVYFFTSLIMNIIHNWSYYLYSSYIITSLRDLIISIAYGLFCCIIIIPIAGRIQIKANR